MFILLLFFLLLQFCRLPLHACSEATLRGVIDLLLLSLPLPPIFCSPCLCFSYLSPVFLPFSGNPHPLVIAPVFCRLENASHYFSHFARDACLAFFSSSNALLGFCILIIISILVLDDLLLDLLCRAFLFSLIIFAGVFILIIIIIIILTTSLLALCCTLFSSSSSSFRTGFLDSSGSGRGTKGSGSGGKFLDLIF